MKLVQNWIVGLAVLLLGNVTYAEVSSVSDGDKTLALGLLNEGLVHCTIATQSSRTEQTAAQTEYELYVLALTRAQAIYPKIAEHSRTLSRQIQQCTQIGDDIARAQALPLLQQGVLACKEAKELAKGDYLSKARGKYKEYLELRDKAIALTDSVLKVASNSSKVRRCDKLENGLLVAQTRVEKEEVAANELISLLRRAEDSCQVAQNMAVKSGESRARLEATKGMFVYAERYFHESQLHKEASKRARNYPGYLSSKKIAKLVGGYTVCRDELVVVIDAATQSVSRQEELAKIREQQKLNEAVVLAVAEAKKEAIAALNAKEKAQVKTLEKPQGAVQSGEESVAQPAEVVSVAEAKMGPLVTDQDIEKSATARTRPGKTGRGTRVDVVQVIETW